jgi:2-C-methyl-D-erythritol 4-phosphate cytidylyltransferase
MVAAIVVAAGKGRRMGGPRPKQYMPLGGKPLLAHTLRAFDRCSAVESVYVVLPGEDLSYCRETILPLLNRPEHVRLVSGGARRQDSVYNALACLAPSVELVVIHDGVRPLVQAQQIEAVVKGAREHGACLLAVPVEETVKQVDRSGRVTGTLERSRIWLAQTPQAFRTALIQKAHRQARRENFSATDDAALVERMGALVKVIPGGRENIKITVAEDLALAETLLARRQGRGGAGATGQLAGDSAAET